MDLLTTEDYFFDACYIASNFHRICKYIHAYLQYI